MIIIFGGCLLAAFRWARSTIFLTRGFIFSVLLWGSSIRTHFSLDFIRGPLIRLRFWLAPLMLIARAYIIHRNLNQKRFIFLFILLNFFIFVFFVSRGAICFYLFFEASLLPTLCLILWWGYQPERVEAGLYIMIYTIVASLPFLILLLHVGILDIWTKETPLWAGLRLVVFRAFLVKIPIFHTHLWLPKAHVEAPVAGRIILAGILLKLGGYGILRFSSLFVYLNFKISHLICSISLLGGCLRSLACCRAQDMKSLIAYSSVAHIGFLLVSSFGASETRSGARRLIMLAHGVSSRALFSLCFITYLASTSRGLPPSKGLGICIPLVSFWWIFLSLGNMGTPPTFNYSAEVAILLSVVSFIPIRSWFLGVRIFLRALYSLVLYTRINHGRTLISPYYPSYFSLSSVLHLVPIISLVLVAPTLFI